MIFFPLVTRTYRALHIMCIFAAIWGCRYCASWDYRTVIATHPSCDIYSDSTEWKHSTSTFRIYTNCGRRTSTFCDTNIRRHMSTFWDQNSGRHRSTFYDPNSGRHIYTFYPQEMELALAICPPLSSITFIYIPCTDTLLPRRVGAVYQYTSI